MSGLVYIGKVIALEDVANSDFLSAATVVCGPGGKWRGVVRRGDFEVGYKCMVYLPDSIVPKSEAMSFMSKTKWRVRMCRFRGCPSEVVIMPRTEQFFTVDVGVDITEATGVTKYVKEIPPHMAGQILGSFPTFIPKTDEPNYQTAQELVEELKGKPYYITQKLDGCSTTAYRLGDHFGVCSRNLELKPDANNGYWKIALQYDLPKNLPDGIAVQWESVGPKIQNNPMRLNSLDGYIFSAYNIENQCYLEFKELQNLCQTLQMPMAPLSGLGVSFDDSELDKRAIGLYESGEDQEGIVIRSLYNHGHKPISFKVINLDYKN